MKYQFEIRRVNIQSDETRVFYFIQLWDMAPKKKIIKLVGSQRLDLQEQVIK